MSVYSDKEYYGLTDKLGKGGLPPDQKYRIFVETDDMWQIRGFTLDNIMYLKDAQSHAILVTGCWIMQQILGTWRKKHV